LTDELEEFKEREEGILNIVMDYADGSLFASVNSNFTQEEICIKKY
jgi:hypothetical protein